LEFFSILAVQTPKLKHDQDGLF